MVGLAGRLDVVMMSDMEPERVVGGILFILFLPCLFFAFVSLL